MGCGPERPESDLRDINFGYPGTKHGPVCCRTRNATGILEEGVEECLGGFDAKRGLIQA